MIIILLYNFYYENYFLFNILNIINIINRIITYT